MIFKRTDKKNSFLNDFMTGQRLLLVDDDSTCLGLMKEILEEGYTLEIARSGEEALAIAPDFKPDLVVLDVMMPGIDGFEVCQSLQNGDATGLVKYIFVSAREPNLDRKNHIKSAGFGFLLKPFDPDDLEDQISQMLASS